MSEKRFWRDVGVEGLGVADFPFPSVVDNGEDELHRLPPRRIVVSAVGALRFLCSFYACTDNGYDVVVDCGIVHPHPRGFEECHALARDI